MPFACSTAGPRPGPASGARRRRPVPRGPLAAALLAVCLTPAVPGRGQTDIAGRYEHAGAVAATLDIRPVPEGWAVRLEGGGSPMNGAAAAADCLVEARATLRGSMLEVRFGEDASRRLLIETGPGVAEVLEADTFGLCGFATTFIGPYRRR